MLPTLDTAPEIYRSIPRETISAPRSPVPVIAMPAMAPLEDDDFAALPVALPAPVGTAVVLVAVVVIIEELGKRPDDAADVVVLLEMVTNEAEIVVVVAGTELTLTVTVAPAAVELPDAPELLRPLMEK